jgi:hypothetical protein
MQHGIEPMNSLDYLNSDPSECLRAWQAVIPIRDGRAVLCHNLVTLRIFMAAMAMPDPSDFFRGKLFPVRW